MGATSSTFPYVSLYQVGKGWRITTATVGGRRLTRRLGTNAAYAKRRAAKISDWFEQWKSELIDESKLLQLLGESVPVSPLVDKFRAGLTEKGRDDRYIRDRVSQIKLLIDRAGIVQLKHLTKEAIAAGMDSLREKGGAEGEKLADQTLRYYLAAMIQFGRWLKKKGYVEKNPIEDIEREDGAIEKVHERRAPTKLEAALLIHHLWALPRTRGRSRTTGRDRAMLYLYAMGTGLRADELRQLQIDWLNRETGILRVPGTVTKNDKDVFQPLARWLVEATFEWHPTGTGSLFAEVPGDTAERVRIDQRATRKAWIEEAKDDPEEHDRRVKSTTLLYKTAAGHFDFHALRHFFITMLGRGGAGIKELQTLARHSTPVLTFGVYSHTEAEQLQKVVDSVFIDPTPKALPSPEQNTKGGDVEAQAHRAAQ